MLYPLGACSPASRICRRSSGGIGAPSKLGVALRSWIAWLNVFLFFVIVSLFNFIPKMPVQLWEINIARYYVKTTPTIALHRQKFVSRVKNQRQPSGCRSSPAPSQTDSDP